MLHHEETPSVISKIWVEFDDWADTLIRDLMNMPNLSNESEVRHRAKIEALQSGKINLQRIIKNYVDNS